MVRVWEQARRAESLGGLWVATDCERIADAIRSAGGNALLTRSDHPSGLDRVAEAVRLLDARSEIGPSTIIVNIQGDEPFLNPAGVDHLIRLFERPEVRMATLATEFRPDENFAAPNRVKVVLDRKGRALYFSRSPIPYAAVPHSSALLHVGVYAYRRATLLELADLEPCALERTERLEQLRALWNGIPIHVAVGAYDSMGVDTPEDLARARTRWEEGGANS